MLFGESETHSRMYIIPLNFNRTGPPARYFPRALTSLTGFSLRKGLCYRGIAAFTAVSVLRGLHGCVYASWLIEFGHRAAAHCQHSHGLPIFIDANRFHITPDVRPTPMRPLQSAVSATSNA